MRKRFILTTFAAAVFFISNIYTVDAVYTNSGSPSETSAPISTNSVTGKTDAYGFKIGSEFGSVKVTLTTPRNYATSSWGSTRLTLEGQNDICVNHGNHPLASLQTYQELLTLKAPQTAGKYDLLIQPFVTDDCVGAIGTAILDTVTVPLPCLNCSVKETDEESMVAATSTTSTTSTSIGSSTPKLDDIRARQDRKKIVDTFINTYQNNPDFKEILFLIQLLIALGIIQV